MTIDLHTTIDDLGNQFSELGTSFNHGFATIVESYGTLVTALHDITQIDNLETVQKIALAALQVTGESIAFAPAAEYALRSEVVDAQVLPQAPAPVNPIAEEPAAEANAPDVQSTPV